MWLRSAALVLGIGFATVTGRCQAAAAPMEHTHMASAPSTALRVTVNGTATTISVAELEAMPQKTVTVKNAHSKAEETYTGVAVSDLLAKLGAAYEKNERGIDHSYLKASGTDGYWVLYSASEVEPAVHRGDVIVATRVGGEALKADGAFKLVASEDQKPARWVRNLSTLELKSAE